LSFIIETFQGALRRIFSLDPEVLLIFWFSLKVGLVATFVGLIISLPIAWFFYKSPRWEGMFSVILQILLSVPTVIIGTLVYLFISRNGPLGALEMLYTPLAIIIGDVFLVIPLMTVFIKSAFEQLPKGLEETARNLGAGPFQTFVLICRECRGPIASAICTGFGRVISEVGCAMILGGNIKGLTRTLTTAIALEMGKGETEQSLALGILLLALAMTNAYFIFSFQKKFKKEKVVLPFELDISSDSEGESPEIRASFSQVKPIVLENLSKTFGEKPIFENLSASLDLTGGLALMGKSGSGKTTLLRIIAGLTEPDSGRVDLAGRKAVLIFQRPHLFYGTVMENLTLGLRLRGVSKRKAEKKVENIVKDLDLTAITHRLCENLSGGEIARVSLGRALAIEPEILLLDESLVHIDSESIDAIKRNLRQFMRNGGGLVVVTHNQAIARLFCANVFSLEKGRLVRLFPPV